MAISLNGGTGVITGVSVGGLPDGIVDTDMLAAGAVTAPKRGAGGILQVQQTVLKSRASVTGTSSYALIPNFSVAITPASTSNKVLVHVMLAFISNGQYAGSNLRLARTISGTTTNDFFIGTQVGSNRWTGTVQAGAPMHYSDGNYGPGITHIHYLDSPSTTSEVSYGLQLADANGSADTIYINAAGAYNSDNGAYGITVSSITATEIAG